MGRRSRVARLLGGAVLWGLLSLALGVTSASADSPIAWNQPMTVDPGYTLQGVSCASESFCVATDSYGHVVGSTNPTGGVSAWTTAAARVDHGGPISCPSSSLCVVADGQGNMEASTDPLGGSPWSVAPAVFPSQFTGQNVFYTDPQGVSCPSTSFCLAVGLYVQCFPSPPGDCLIGNPAGWLATSQDPAGGSGAWTTFGPKGVGLTSVSCVSASFCAAGDFTGDVLTSTNPSGDTWQTTKVDSSGSQILSISCPLVTLCVATDGNGTVFVSTNPTGGPSAWVPTQVTTPDYIQGTGDMTSVSCAASTLCVAVDGQGNAYSTTNPVGGVWTVQRIDTAAPVTPQPVNNLSVSCPSIRLCVAVDQSGNAIVGTGAPQTVAPQAAPPPTAAPVSAPSLSSLRVSPRTFRRMGRRAGQWCVALSQANRRDRPCRRPISLRISYRLSNPAQVTFTIQRVLMGKRVNGRCVAPARANRHHRSCTRLIAVRGAIVRASHAGHDSFTFSGKIGARRLGPGTYRLIAAPTSGGLTGAPRRVSFRIA